MKKVLFVYPEMMIGGSTTALLSFLNALPSEKYEIDLQLLRNRGTLLDELPENVRLLPQAEIYTGVMGRTVKIIKFIFSGYFFRSLYKGMTGHNRQLFSRSEALNFQVSCISRKNNKRYDYAIGYLEGWSDRYVAFQANAKRKYAWLHSTFSNITSEPREEICWMKKVDQIVFVADSCRKDFDNQLPEMSSKAITIPNLFDSSIIKKRSQKTDETDTEYVSYISSNLFKIITVCRLTIQVKGLDRIVACAKFLKQSGQRFIWYIIGDGNDRGQLECLIRENGVEDCLVLIGERSNPYPFIAAADVMCMPSRYEGKPMTVTESLVLGIPPIVTRYLSANEHIQNGIDGIVVDNTDDSIFEIMERCLCEASLVASLKKNIAVKDYGNMFCFNEIEEKLFCEKK